MTSLLHWFQQTGSQSRSTKQQPNHPTVCHGISPAHVQHLSTSHPKCWIERIRLPEFLVMNDGDTHARLFDELWNLHPPTLATGQIASNGQPVTFPRYVQSFGRSYQFSGRTDPAKPIEHPFMRAMIEWARDMTGLPVEILLINFMDGGAHGIGWHPDSQHGLMPESPVISLSYMDRMHRSPLCDRLFQVIDSATYRKFTGAKERQKRAERTIRLNTNDCIVMCGAFQSHFLHQVVREPHKTGRRLNFTMRVMQDSVDLQRCVLETLVCICQDLGGNKRIMREIMNHVLC